MSRNYNSAMELTINVIGGRWKVLILWYLMEKPYRHGELKRKLSKISTKMLVEQLRELESDQLITRKSFPEMPVRVEYSLTPQGKSLKPILDLLCDWGYDYIKEMGIAFECCDEEEGGEPII